MINHAIKWFGYICILCDVTIPSHPIQPHPTPPHPTPPHPIPSQSQSHPIQSHPILSYPILSHPILSYPKHLFSLTHVCRPLSEDFVYHSQLEMHTIKGFISEVICISDGEAPVGYSVHQMATLHDDVIKCVTGPLCGDQWRGALMFSLICALNKRLSKQWWDWWLRRQRHYDIIVMVSILQSYPTS